MPHYRSLALLVTMLVVCCGWPAATVGMSGPAVDLPVTRDLEPVIVSGIFDGAPLGEIFVYRQGTGGLEPVPYQIDERDGSGAYVASEDGLLDANDEIVFLARDLGGQATLPPTATLPIDARFYQVTVSEPGDPSSQEFAYLVRSTTLTATSPLDYVSYNPLNRQINATNYSQGFAGDFAGVDVLSLFGGADLLDRTKLRIRYRFFTTEQTLTENSALFNPTPPTVIRDGAVRLILSQGSSTTLAYASYLRSSTDIDLSSLPASIELQEVRISIDLNSSAAGATYYDENTPGGVTIDGTPDSVAATPVTRIWRQISLAGGTIIQLVELSDTGGTISRYYRDDSALDVNDTGDQRSYGDAGIILTAPTARRIIVENTQYILPGTLPAVGAAYDGLAQNPLAVTAVQFGGPAESALYIPMAIN